MILPSLKCLNNFDMTWFDLIKKLLSLPCAYVSIKKLINTYWKFYCFSLVFFCQKQFLFLRTDLGLASSLSLVLRSLIVYSCRAAFMQCYAMYLDMGVAA
jgi:hypothetical protein